jgi:thiamine biosynthesis lipoprotein ApbE
MTFSARATKRARPLLGTLFSIEGHPDAIEDGFELALRLELALSKFNPDSLLYSKTPIPDKFQSIFSLADRLRDESQGAFDPGASGTLDLSGIAKGWIVDRVAESVARKDGFALVNAGGDLRQIGGDGQVVGLRCQQALRSLKLTRSALASSMVSSPHPSTTYHSTLRAELNPNDLVCALADECAVADGFTKVLLFAAKEDITRMCETWSVQGFVLNPDATIKEQWPAYETDPAL